MRVYARFQLHVLPRYHSAETFLCVGLLVIEPRTSTLLTEPHSWLKSSTFLILYFNLLRTSYMYITYFVKLSMSHFLLQVLLRPPTHPPSQFFVLFIFITNRAHKLHRYRATPWSLGNLPVVISLKKNDSLPASTNCSYLLSYGWGLMNPSLNHAGMLASLILCSAAAEFMNMSHDASRA